MSSLQPSDYAYQWCNTIIGEASECKRGVDYANTNLANKTTGQVIQDCTNSSSIDGFSTSDAFRYGCFLNSAFQGPATNLCAISINLGATNSPVTLNIPCASTCQTVYDASDKNMNVCTDSAQYQFNQSVQNGKCSDPTQLLSCIDGLYQSGSRYNCSQNSSDFDNICKPSVIGCVIGSLQNGILNEIQQYQSNNRLNVTSCANYLYSNPSNPLNPSDPSNPLNPSDPSNPLNPSDPSNPLNPSNPSDPSDPSNPDSNWNPWPEGPTYNQ
jgi:hypothetical protein